MLENIFEILKTRPTLSIIGVLVLAIIFMFLFRDLIRRYLIKKLNLNSEKETKEFAKYYNKKTNNNIESAYRSWKNKKE